LQWGGGERVTTRGTEGGGMRRDLYSEGAAKKKNPVGEKENPSGEKKDLGR